MMETDWRQRNPAPGGQKSSLAIGATHRVPVI